MSLDANLRCEKLLGSSLADDTATFLLEGVLVLWNAFDKDVLLHSSLNVVLDFLTAFRCLKWSGKRHWDSLFQQLISVLNAVLIELIALSTITLKPVDKLLVRLGLKD